MNEHLRPAVHLLLPGARELNAKLNDENGEIMHGIHNDTDLKMVGDLQIQLRTRLRLCNLLGRSVSYPMSLPYICGCTGRPKLVVW